MIPPGLSIWLFLVSFVGIICVAIAVFDGRRWTLEWIGESVKDLVIRHVVGIVVLLLVQMNYDFCQYLCNPWLTLTGLVVYFMSVFGWPISAVIFSVVYLLGNIFWGGILGIHSGPLANLFQLVFFLLSVVVVFLHLRERVLYIALIPIPSALIELSDRTKRARRVMWQSPEPQLPVTGSLDLRQERASPRATEGGGASPPPQPAPEPPRAAPPSRRVQSASVAASDLYLLTMLIEGGAALIRSAIYFVVSLVVLSPIYLFIFMSTRNRYLMPAVNLWGAETGQWAPDYMRWFTTNLTICLTISLVVGLVLGCLPLLRSLFHIVYPYSRSGAGEHERETLGAREPTRAEHQKIIDTLDDILSSIDGTARMPKIAAPSTWLVIDAPTPDAYTIGSTIYVTRAAIEDTHFAGIVAHELGHLAHKDGDLILALRRFVIPLAYFVGVDRQPTPAGAVWTRGTGAAVAVIRNEDEKIFYRFKALQIKFMLAFWFGGLGMFVLGQQWARFWRSRDFLADDYAVELGQTESLMGILKTYQHVDVAQPFLLSNRPYTAERLDRLQG